MTLRIPDGLEGAVAGPVVGEVDARWLMAYAAALGDLAPVYLDTARAGGIAAHPLFPVCYEWRAGAPLRDALPDGVAGRAVHLTHDLRLHRLPRPGDRLATTARVTAVAAHRAGALVVTRFETVDAAGAPVSVTDHGTLYRGVAPPPGVRPPAGDGEGAGSASAPAWTAALPVAAGLAHVYTEGARIWNPIHTDRAVALAAGLPGIILHGTATLALAASELVRREADGDPRRVRRVAGRFAAMVELPSTLTLRVFGAGGPERGLAFDVLTAGGRAAVRAGRFDVRPPGAGAGGAR
jgi:acyl dehydratase